MTRLRHYDNLETARFVTFSCFRQLPALQSDRAKEIFIEQLEVAREKHAFRLLGYVIMPEHVHLVLHPPDRMKLGVVIGEIKPETAREYFADVMEPTASCGAPRRGRQEPTASCGAPTQFLAPRPGAKRVFE